MNPQKAFQELCSHPDRFLKSYPLSCAGDATPHAPGQVNLRTFYLSARNPNSLGTHGGKVGHYGASRPGRILPFREHDISSYKIEGYASPGVASHMLQGLSVPMVSSAAPFNPAQIDPYILDGSSDGVMVTGQLTGCCFCWSVVGTSLWCAHIRPAPPMDGNNLHNLVNISGRFAHHPATMLSNFGRGDYPAAATVIGVRRAGTWNLYAQLSADSHLTVTQAYRLHPGGRMQL